MKRTCNQCGKVVDDELEVPFWMLHRCESGDIRQYQADLEKFRRLYSHGE